MKRIILLLLVICIVEGTLASCGRSDVPTQTTTEETFLIENVTIDETTETTTEEMTTETSDIEETALEPAPEEWETWQKKALDVMQSSEIKYVPELAYFTFTLQDLSQDGIPEIIEDIYYIESHRGPEAIWTWYNGNYVQVYSAGSDHQIQSITAYRNKQTGKIELWDLGNIDFELKDYYPDPPDSNLSEVFGPYDPINDHIRRLEFIDGKLQIVESHDELKNFATYDMSDEQVRRAWEALHDFSTAFWKTHDPEPVEIHSKSIDFLQFSWHFGSLTEDDSVLLSKSDLPQERQYRTSDYYSNLEPQHEIESYKYNRNHLRAIIEEYE